MIWWRGNGMWLATLVAVIVLAAGQGGPRMCATGLLLSAVIIHFLKDEESSLYSFPVRYWPPLLGLCSLLVFFDR